MSVRHSSLFRAIRHYAGKFQTMRDEIRTERFLASLPTDIRRDIGWPDRFSGRAGGRN